MPTSHVLYELCHRRYWILNFIMMFRNRWLHKGLWAIFDEIAYDMRAEHQYAAMIVAWYCCHSLSFNGQSNCPAKWCQWFVKLSPALDTLYGNGRKPFRWQQSLRLILITHWIIVIRWREIEYVCVCVLSLPLSIIRKSYTRAVGQLRWTEGIWLCLSIRYTRFVQMQIKSNVQANFSRTIRIELRY